MKTILVAIFIGVIQAILNIMEERERCKRHFWKLIESPDIIVKDSKLRSFIQRFPLRIVKELLRRCEQGDVKSMYCFILLTEFLEKEHPLFLSEGQLSFLLEVCVSNAKADDVEMLAKLHWLLEELFDMPMWKPEWHMVGAELLMQRPDLIDVQTLLYLVAMRDESPAAWERLVNFVCRTVMAKQLADTRPWAEYPTPAEYMLEFLRLVESHSPRHRIGMVRLLIA